MDTVEALYRYRVQVEEALRLSRTMSFLDLVEMVKDGKLIGYQSERAVLICELVRMHVGWLVTMFVGAGDHDGVMELVEQCEADAKRAGASGTVAIGRPGWIKDARKRGYRAETVIYVKELS
jgi:hypothetical protein